jgi:hypothetical protein
MRALIEILAGLAIPANAVSYGTNVFGAIVLRPAIAAVDDRTLTQLPGHIHRIADRRFAAIGTGGLTAAIAMAALAAATGHWASTAAGALAALALCRTAAEQRITPKRFSVLGGDEVSVVVAGAVDDLDRGEARLAEYLARCLLSPHGAQAHSAFSEGYGHAVHARNRVQPRPTRMP